MNRNINKIFLFIASILVITSVSAQNNQLPLHGTYNFRDIGGYVTKDKKKIKSGKIYRSATLAGLTPEDTLLLSLLNNSKVVDFRGPKEIAYGPDILPKQIKHIACDAGSVDGMPDDWGSMAADMKKSTVSQSDEGAENYYRNVSSLADRYKPMFQELLDLPKDSAMIIHCVGGKDRTGIGAALIEYVLGVGQQQIIVDYELTNKYRKSYNEEVAIILVKKYGVSPQRAKDYGIAKGKFLLASFDALAKQYGSLDLFIQNGLGLDAARINKLKELYLE